MKKIKRVLAVIAVILLVSMYVITFISSIIDSPNADSLFKASLYATFVVPVFIYAVMLVYRLVKKKSDDQDQ